MRKQVSLLHGLLLATILTGSSCSSALPTEDEKDPVSAVETVYMAAEDIVSGNDPFSRTNLTLGDNKIIFSWAEQDQVGVVPIEGSQIFFRVQSGAGSKNAIFDGGAWALKTDALYAAYFPYSKVNTDRNRPDIYFSYQGQLQKGNASLAHLGGHDLMAAARTSTIDNLLQFEFKHMNAVGRFHLTLPVVDEFTSFRIECKKPIFASEANVDFSGDQVVYTGEAKQNFLQLDLAEVKTTAQQKEIVLYMMLPPTDFTSEKVQVTLQNKTAHTYEGVLTQKNMVAGRAYDFKVTMKDKTLSSDVEAPDFGDGDVEI